MKVQFKEMTVAPAYVLAEILVCLANFQFVFDKKLLKWLKPSKYFQTKSVFAELVPLKSKLESEETIVSVADRS